MTSSLLGGIETPLPLPLVIMSSHVIFWATRPLDLKWGRHLWTAPRGRTGKRPRTISLVWLWPTNEIGPARGKISCVHLIIDPRMTTRSHIELWQKWKADDWWRVINFFSGRSSATDFLVSLRLTEKGNERQNITFSWRRYIEIFWSLNLSKEAGDGLENVTHRMASDWKTWRSIQGFWCLSIPEFQKSNKRNSWRVEFNCPFLCEPSIVYCLLSLFVYCLFYWFSRFL